MCFNVKKKKKESGLFYIFPAREERNFPSDKHTATVDFEVDTLITSIYIVYYINMI